MKFRNLMASSVVAVTVATGALATGHGWSLKEAAAP